ncbi:unnamed protein product [Cylindrotheca closterium]|uniref:Uncharacterized protein n=1 Tax=Cylindrotheca closterium TaxID=2856 RepID=A0AAD2G5N4_9STRA|nr:unnamed protein product [Cylindrotheca closterium]
MATTSSSYNGSIPGLKREHFTCDFEEDDEHQLCIPTMTKSKIYSDGQSFYFSWTASYGRRQKYYLQATGNIAKGDQWKNNGPKWWGFECRCSCPGYAEQEQKTIDSNYMEHHVCHHLQIALELCVDLMANKEPPSPTSVVERPTTEVDERTLSLPAPPSMEETIVPVTQRESPTKDNEYDAQIIIPGLTRLHFIDDSTRCKCRRAPILKAADIDQKCGEFEVHWQAAGEIGDDDEDECYNLRASGNIKQLEKVDGPQWWGFSVSCDCPEFLRQRLRCDTESGWTENFVCPHLGRALELATDPEQMKKGNNKNDTEGEGSMDTLLATDGSDAISRDFEQMKNYNNGNDSEDDNSMDALLTVNDSDGSTSIARYPERTRTYGNEDEDSMVYSADEHSMDALVTVDGSSEGSTSIILEGENSLGSLLSNIDNASVDGSSMSAILSVE